MRCQHSTSASDTGSNLGHARFFANGSTRDINQMVVMGEVNDLRFCRQVAERLEALGSAIIAVVYEKIVGDEGERLGVLQLHLNGGKTEGQEELVFSANGEPIEIDMVSVGASAH